MNKKSCRCYLRIGDGIYSADPLKTKKNVFMAMANMMMQLDREMCCVIHLNKEMTPISFNVCSIGTLNASLGGTRESYKAALLDGAAYILFLHNHPSGDITPSEADLGLTKKLIAAGRLIGVPLVDHIIVGYEDEKPLYGSVRGDYDKIWEMPEPVNPPHVLKEVEVRMKLKADFPGLYAKSPQMAALSLLPKIGGCGENEVIITVHDTKTKLLKVFRIPKDKAASKRTIQRVMREAVVNNAAMIFLFTADWPKLPSEKLIKSYSAAASLMDIRLVDAISIDQPQYRSAMEEKSLPQVVQPDRERNR